MVTSGDSLTNDQSAMTGFLAPIDQNYTVSSSPNNTTAFNPPSTFTGAANGFYQNVQNMVNSTSVSPQGGQTSGGSKVSGDLGTVGDAYKFLNGGFKSVTNSINDFGSSLGFASQSGAPVSASIAGPTNAFDTAGSLSSSSLSSVIGGAGFGFAAGGFISNLVGGNPLGGSIGGALGGALGATFLGGLTGVEMGATLGSIVPGIGTVIGAAAGSLLGGLFGGHSKPHPAGGFNNGVLDSTGKISDYNLTGKHEAADFGSTLANPLQSYLQQQAKTYGIKYNDGITVGSSYDVGGNVGDGNPNNKYGIYVNTGGKDSNLNDQGAKGFFYSDAASQQQAYQDAFNYIATNSGYDPSTLKPVNSTAGTDVQIPSTNTPSAWQKFLADYRTQHPATTPQNPPTNPNPQGQ